MSRLLRAFVVVGLAMACQPINSFADITVESWYLDSGVVSSSSQGIAFSNVVQNPYQQTLHGTLGTSFADTSHDFGWTGDSAQFDAYPYHFIQQTVDDTSSISEASIQLRPAVDSTITLWGTIDYGWPDFVSGYSELALNVYDPIAGEDVAGASDLDGNFVGGLNTGTLHAEASGLLQAGRLYELTYSASMNLYDPTPPSYFGESSGEIHFTIAPVPEPAALALLLPAVLLSRRRRPIP